MCVSCSANNSRPQGMAAEAEERWGDTETFRESMRRTAGFKSSDWKRIQGNSQANLKALVTLMKAGRRPEDPEVQAEIARHHAGVEEFYPCSTEIYRGLAEMYLADERFRSYYEKHDLGLPEFLVAGMRHFCDRRDETTA
jgi:hypothetical protein